MKYLKKFEGVLHDMKGTIKHEIGGRPYVLGDDGKIYNFGCSNIMDDYPHVFDLDTDEIDGISSWYRKSIKPYVGMMVRFIVNSKNGYAYNYEIKKVDNL